MTRVYAKSAAKWNKQKILKIFFWNFICNSSSLFARKGAWVCMRAYELTCCPHSILIIRLVQRRLLCTCWICWVSGQTESDSKSNQMNGISCLPRLPLPLRLPPLLGNNLLMLSTFASHSHYLSLLSLLLRSFLMELLSVLWITNCKMPLGIWQETPLTPNCPGINRPTHSPLPTPHPSRPLPWRCRHLPPQAKQLCWRFYWIKPISYACV